MKKSKLLELTNGGLLFYLWVYEQNGIKLKVRGNKIENTICLFYDDGKPSFSIYWKAEKQQWYFRDFGSNGDGIDYYGDVFTFASYYFNIPLKQFYKLLEKMMQSIEGYEPAEKIEMDTENLRSSSTRIKKAYNTFELNTIEPTSEAKTYFGKYGIDLSDFGNVEQIEGITYYNSFKEVAYRKRVPADQIHIAYDFGSYAKIYCPNPKKFWYVGDKPKHYMFGDLDYTDNIGEPIFLGGGEKDVMKLISLGFMACCLESEKIMPPKELFDDFYEYKLTPVVLYDLDDTGKASAKKISEKFGCKIANLDDIIPDDYNGEPIKDVSDYANNGLDIDVLKNFLNSFHPLNTPIQEDVEEANDIKDLEDIKENEKLEYEGLSEELYDMIPDLIKEVCYPITENHERDLVLIATIVFLSNILAVRGVYDQKRYYSNLMLFITAPASAGKGVLRWVKVLGSIIHNNIIRQYMNELEEYNKLELKERRDSDKPVRKSFFIPGNSSVAAMKKQLSNNDGFGMIIESEADTINAAMKSEWGDYSEVLRNAFEFETISNQRMDEDNTYEIQTPRLSMIITGTKNQLLDLIPSSENGLFSRFMFMEFPLIKKWKNVFKSTESLEPYYKNIAKELFAYHKKHKKDYLNIRYTKKQQELFNQKFEGYQDQFDVLFGKDIISSIRRLGSIHFRICMILTGARYINLFNDLKNEKVIEVIDKDFEIANQLVSFFLENLKSIYSYLPETKKVPKSFKRKEAQLYECLNNEFTFSEFRVKAHELEIKKGTDEGYLRRFLEFKLIERISHGIYQKKSL